MVIKKFSEISKMTNLSQEDSWSKVLAAVKDTDDDVKIDFSDIIIQRPLSFGSFKLLLQMPNIYMVFKNESEIVEAVKTWMMINGIDNCNERIESIIVEKPVEKSRDQKKIESYGDRVCERFEKDESRGDKAYIYNIVKSGGNSTIGNPTTFQYIEYAINKLRNTCGINKFTLNINGVTLQDDFLFVRLAELEEKMENSGIEFNILVDDKNTDVISALEKALYTVRNKYSNENERYNYIKDLKNMYNGFRIPGLLMKYKDSKAKDVYGRHGSGQCEWCRIAIFQKVVSGNKDPKTGEVRNVVLRFKTFFESNFYTNIHWSSQHDGEQHPGLKTEIVDVRLSDIGFTNVFMGSRYHFNLPTQRDRSECIKMITGLTERGTTVSTECTIPERMKIVFDDFGIKYNEEAMNKSIENTKSIKEKVIDS